MSRRAASTQTDETTSHRSCDFAHRPATARPRAADLQKLQAGCLELADHPVQGARVDEPAGQQRVLTASAGGQRGECFSSWGRSARCRGSRSAAARDRRSLCPLLTCDQSRRTAGERTSHRSDESDGFVEDRLGATVLCCGRRGSAVEPASFGVRGVVPRPGLFERLGSAERVVHVSAPADSGKTFPVAFRLGEIASREPDEIA